MAVPPKRKYPQFHSQIAEQNLGQDMLDLTQIGKKILRGEYVGIQGLELDLGFVLTTFAQAYETEKPEVAVLVQKIKKVYVNLKKEAVQSLEPFIIVNGPWDKLPPFVEVEILPEHDVIRCICETYSEEGTMIQCERCFVWQHCDCVGVTSNDPTQYNKRKQSKSKSKSSTPSKSNSCSPSKLYGPRLALPNTEEDQVKIDDLLINVNEVLPVVEASTKQDDMDAVPTVPIDEMETQMIVPDPVDMEVDESKDNKRNVQVERGFVGDLSEHYYCELCAPREMPDDVRVGAEFDEPDKTFYLKLRREDGLCVRKNDTVYVLRDVPANQKLNAGKDAEEVKKPARTYLNAGPLNPLECDIFRVDSLWKDAR